MATNVLRPAPTAGAQLPARKAALRNAMFWRLVLRALRLRLQRVAVVFAALTVGAAIVTAMSAVYFDINAKMSNELRTFGANFYLGPGHGNSLPESLVQPIIDSAARYGLLAKSFPAADLIDPNAVQ